MKGQVAGSRCRTRFELSMTAHDHVKHAEMAKVKNVGKVNAVAYFEKALLLLISRASLR